MVYLDENNIFDLFMTSSFILWRHQQGKTRFIGGPFVACKIRSRTDRDFLKTVLNSWDQGLSNHVSYISVFGNLIFRQKNGQKQAKIGYFLGMSLASDLSMAIHPIIPLNIICTERADSKLSKYTFGLSVTLPSQKLYPPKVGGKSLKSANFSK